MPSATTFSETSLAELMHRSIGDMAAALGWTVEDDSYADVVDDTLLDYGVDTVADVGTGREDIAKLRALAKRAVWRAVVAALASRFDVDLDSQKLSRSQMQTMAKAALGLAENEAARYGAGDNVAIVSAIRRPHDPYAVLSDIERVIP